MFIQQLQHWTDTYITGGFSLHIRFGGFLPIIRPRLKTTILRGLSTIANYYNGVLHRSPLSDGVGDAGAERDGQILRPTSLLRSRRKRRPPNPCAVQLARRRRWQCSPQGRQIAYGCAGRRPLGNWSGDAGPFCLQLKRRRGAARRCLTGPAMRDRSALQLKKRRCAACH